MTRRATEARAKRRLALTGRDASALLLLALVLSIGGCSRAHSDQNSVCSCATAAVVDATLLAFLSKASAAHHLADLAIARGDGASGIAALVSIDGAPWPASSPEAREVVADTRARLSDLRSAQGDFDGALRDINEGLGLVDAPTHFRGHLLELRGIVLERQAAALEKAGDAEAAGRAKAAAVSAFGAAIEVQDAVISRALQDAGRR